MTAYRIVRGTLCQGAAGTWGVLAGGVELDYPTSWRASLTGSKIRNISVSGEDCTLNLDLEGGGQLRGLCSVVDLTLEEVQVESHCEPTEFVEPIAAEPD